MGSPGQQGGPQVVGIRADSNPPVTDWLAPGCSWESLETKGHEWTKQDPEGGGRDQREGGRLVGSGSGLGLGSVMGSGQAGGIWQASGPESQSLHERLR